MGFPQVVHAAIASAALAFLTSTSALPTQGTIIDWDWSSSTEVERINRFEKISVCQFATVAWKGNRNLYEFPDHQSYRDCDFSAATEVAPTSDTGIVTISDDETSQVTKKYFGSSIGCEHGTKFLLKVNPFLDITEGFECSGGHVAEVSPKSTLLGCRRRCVGPLLSMKDCVGYQYDKSSLQCIIYTRAPSGLGNRNADMTCAIASTSCPSPWDELNSAIQIYRSNNFTDSYRFETTRYCDCMDEMTAPMVVRVEGSEQEATYVDGSDAVPSYLAFLVMNIEEQFDMIQKALDSNAHTVSVIYHELHGYPLSLYINYVKGRDSSNVIIANKNLAPN